MITNLWINAVIFPCLYKSGFMFWKSGEITPMTSLWHDQGYFFLTLESSFFCPSLYCTTVHGFCSILFSEVRWNDPENTFLRLFKLNCICTMGPPYHEKKVNIWYIQYMIYVSYIYTTKVKKTFLFLFAYWRTGVWCVLWCEHGHIFEQQPIHSISKERKKEKHFTLNFM